MAWSTCPSRARQLLRQCKAARRRTIAQEVTLARLARAKELLHLTSLSHEAVAKGCGFRAARRMARVFQQYEHTSPKAWRARAAEKPPSGVYPLDQAKLLLERTNYPVLYIAQLTGYGTDGRLASAFERQEGMTVWDYRHRFGRFPLGARPVPLQGAQPDEEKSYRIVIAENGSESKTEFEIPSPVRAVAEGEAQGPASGQGGTSG